MGAPAGGQSAAAGGSPLNSSGPLSAESLDELLQPARNTGEAPPGDLLSGNEIDALLQQQGLGDALGRAPSGLTGAEALLNRAEAGIAAAVAPELRPSRMPGVQRDDARPFEFEPFARVAE